MSNPKLPPVETRFKAGQSGNPGGKPRGSRNALQGDFMRRLADDFERFGIYAIARARRSDPLGYVKVVASLMPKEMTISRPMEDLTDDELTAGIALLRSRLADGDGAGSGTEAQPQSVN